MGRAEQSERHRQRAQEINQIKVWQEVVGKKRNRSVSLTISERQTERARKGKQTKRDRMVTHFTNIQTTVVASSVLVLKLVQA